MKGSCHCGAVRYEVDADPMAGTMRCNCTPCTKSAAWGLHVKPAAFRLLSGEEVLGDYSRSPRVHARFCKVCGFRCFGHGDLAEIGGPFVSENLNTVDDVDLTGVPVRYLDGRADTWQVLAASPQASPFKPASA